MSDKPAEKKKLNLFGYGKAVTFLCLEILAMVSFSLGGSFVFFAILSIVIVLLIALVTYKEIKLDKISSIGIFLFPLLLFAVISCLSYFRYDPYFILGNSPVLILVPLTLICFASAGYLVNLTGCFKIRHALIIIYSAIALLTFINLLVTMIQFVPFYSLKYNNYYYYYNGVPSPSPIGQMAYFLMGFSMTEVSLAYFSFYPMILLTAFLPLGHRSFKQDRKLYLLFIAFGLLGLVSLILTINKVTLLMLFGVSILIGIIAIVDKFNINRKALKYTALGFGALVAFGFIILVLNAQDSVGHSMRIDFLRKLTTSNALLNRLFNSNRFFSAYDSILDGLFASATVEGSSHLLKLFGFPINGGYVDLFGAMTWKLTDSNSFLFDSFFTSGLFGVLFLIALLAVGITKVIRYYNYSDDSQRDKVMVLGFVIISLAYALVNFDSTPYIFSKTVVPFYLNNIFFIDLFLMGYCTFKSVKPVEVKVEVNENEEQI